MVIVTTSDLQKNLGSVMNRSAQETVVVTKHGKAAVVMLPYFENNTAALQRYYEDMEMQQNKENLTDYYQQSLDSGRSGHFL